MEPSTDKAFSIENALRFGWRTTQANLKPLLIIAAAGAFLALLGDTLTRPQAAFPNLLGLAVQVLELAVTLALIRAALLLHDKQAVDLSQPKALFENFFSFLLTMVAYGLMVSIGLFLLVVPGVYLGLRYGFAGFLVADQKVDPMEAFRTSSRYTDGVKPELFLFALAMFGVNLLGALAFGVGLLLTVPTTAVASAYVYRRLQARAAALGHVDAERAPPSTLAFPQGGAR